LRGWILDVYPDHDTNTMALWLKTGARCRKLVYDYEPCFYVHHPSLWELRALGRSLERTELAKRTDIVEKRIDIQSTRRADVLAVYPPAYSGINECAHIIDSRGGYYDYRLFNVDVRLSQQFLIERNVFPLALADTSPRLKAHGGQFRVNYRVPNLRTVDLRVKCSGRFPSNHLPIAGITVGDAVLEGAEEDILAGLCSTIREANPDIIFTENGDSFTLPYLYYRATVNGLAEEFRLGREKDDARTTKKARSYFSYGSIVYKPPARKLKGRLHIDRSSFIQEEGGLHALIDLARMSNLPLQTLARLSPGTAISAMQVQQAIRDGYVIQWKKNRPEDFKTADMLLLADRGGFIFDPVVGIHDGIVEVDFISLYPNIMHAFNISPETILCDCCPDSRLRVPELLYNTCEKRVGLIPRVVKPLVQRRLAFKHMIHTRPEMKEAFEQRSDLLKWVLVTCFGYTGYKNARFGRIECHESINAYARDIMIRSMNIAEDFGYDVLHGIIDSLWLTPNGYKDHGFFCRYVSRAIGIPLELQGVFKWLVFLPNKGSDTGALNRYYGLFENDRLKVRGIELRKHDTPVIVRKAQEAMFDVLTRADNSEEFKALIPDAIDELKRHYAMVRRRECPVEDMIVSKRVSRTLEEYSVFNDQVAAMLQLKKQGMAIQPGQKLRFVICDSTTKDPGRRVRVAEMLDGDVNYDAGKYCDLLLRSGESILAPFGYTEERLKREMPV